MKEENTSAYVPTAAVTTATTTTTATAILTTTTTTPLSSPPPQTQTTLPSTTTSITTTTPKAQIVSGLGRFAAKRPTNLNLNIKYSTQLKKLSTETNGESDATEASSFQNTETANSKLKQYFSKTTPSSSTSSQSAPAATLATPTIFPHEQHNNIKKLDIGFENISFSVKAGIFRKENKEILKGVTGKFRSGELTAIVGPSGAGKTTLVNVLSSYTTHDYKGTVTVNDSIRDIKCFRPNMTFITQDTSLQPYLSVKEAMHFSANLKVGTHMSNGAKRERVRKILEAIGMYEKRHTRTGKLSGGQKKRLAIALELVNNPPVLILDEPTSGLDSFTSNQCISILKKLAMEGRTVICTIHQPSALTFAMFDHLYALAEGQCIYSGGPQNLVPFLSDMGLPCPESYNPADYLMEIATDDYGKQNEKLVGKIENGRNTDFLQTSTDRKMQFDAIRKVETMMASGLMTPVTAPLLTPTLTTTTIKTATTEQKQLTPINEMSSLGVLDNCDYASKPNETKALHKAKSLSHLTPRKLCKSSENIYATPFYRQLIILLVRGFLILWRDKSLTLMRMTVHFIAALLIGLLYYGIGNDAGNAFNNFRYISYSIMFLMYCSFSSILVKFPLEFPVVSREHFNRWYSLSAYYVALTLADIPIQLVCTSIYVLITYFMTNQPCELFRLLMFGLMAFLTALVGQSIGLCVGASLDIKLGPIIGPFFISPFLQFSGFFLLLKDTPVYFHWLFYISFLKHSFDGSMLAIFGYDRAKLQCTDIYCHYSRPKIFLKDMDMANANYGLSLLVLIIIFICLRIISFSIMAFRLRLFR